MYGKLLHNTWYCCSTRIHHLSGSKWSQIFVCVPRQFSLVKRVFTTVSLRNDYQYHNCFLKEPPVNCHGTHNPGFFNGKRKCPEIHHSRGKRNLLWKLRELKRTSGVSNYVRILGPYAHINNTKAKCRAADGTEKREKREFRIHLQNRKIPASALGKISPNNSTLCQPDSAPITAQKSSHLWNILVDQYFFLYGNYFCMK